MASGKRGELTSPYLDDGCEVATKCTQCPLPLCRYDDPGGFRNWQDRERRAKLKALLKTGGKPSVVAGTIAAEFSVTTRAGWRILARERLAESS